MFVNSDFSDLLRIFNDHNVRYLVIGKEYERVQKEMDEKLREWEGLQG